MTADDDTAQHASGGAPRIESAKVFALRIVRSDAYGPAHSVAELIGMIDERDAQIRAQALEEAAVSLETEADDVRIPSAFQDPEKALDATFKQSWLRACARRIRALAHADGQQPESGEGEDAAR